MAFPSGGMEGESLPSPLPHSSWSSQSGWKCAENDPDPSGVSWSQRNLGWAQSKQRFVLSQHSWFLARESPGQFWQQWMLMDTCHRGEVENSSVEWTLHLQMPEMIILNRCEVIVSPQHNGRLLCSSTAGPIEPPTSIHCWATSQDLGLAFLSTMPPLSVAVTSTVSPF